MSGGSRLKTDLMSHQKQGLYFLHRREQGLSVFDTTDTTGTNTCKIRGGILADHMGLGKTLTILALITITMDLADAFQAGRNSRACGFILAPRSKATLIVTPVSTLGNWEEQISSHVKPGELSYLVYHGRNRHINPAALNSYDIVITTPSIVAQEWASKHDPLHAIEFYRIVLDEAHDIRTEKTRRSMAICALTAERRWAVTGTPFQNDLSDIATLFKFLKFKPLDTKHGFHNHILADQSGMDNLRSALKAVCLRRTKVVIEANLPSQSVQTHFLDFNDDERKLYNTHKQNLIRSGTRNVKGSAETLRCLSRLRMICDHGQDLLGADMSSGLAGTGLGITCFVCNQQPPGSTAFEGLGCSHRSICAGCIELLPVLDHKLAECEECSVSEVATQEAAPSPAAEIASFPYYQGPSSKVAALLQAIRSEFSADPPSPKHVVFSVWTQMLNLVGIALDKAGIPFCRLDGSMQRARRDEELRKFREDPGCVVLLISLMAGGVGINLTCASRVHMMEPYWNPMVELQAIERVHRLGQTQDVVITRYIIRDSIEKYILDLQEKKIKLAKEALDVGKAHIMKCDVKKEILESLDCILSRHSEVVDL
ncbi:hypothetical protein K440DRAFT_621815 [Wilcoxina mikolae CBS 423.85]|nr:hypothetical protein K440DRAFT_621815 [Wilcoxina mikolae CBS 423.85]